MRVVIACAGTGGHINPGIAIANTILKKEKDSQFIFVGSKNGLENDLVTKAGFNIVNIRSGKMIRRLTLKNVKNLWMAIRGISDAKKILRDFKPDIVIGTGGYICVPVMSAAKSMKIPFVLHESNAFPGMAVKMYAKSANRILLGFENTKKYLPKATCCYTGTPAKFDTGSIDKLNKETCINELNILNNGKKIVFVTGGSQGARKFNNVVVEMVKKHKPKDFFIVIATGMNNYDDVINNVGQDLKEYIQVVKFVYDMDKMYKASDLLITRAGAMTITELSISAKPAILVPLPTAAENHQFHNAKILEQSGAGKIIEEKDLTVDSLYENIISVIKDDEKLSEMSKNARKQYKSGSEDKIYNEILNVLSEGK